MENHLTKNATLVQVLSKIHTSYCSISDVIIVLVVFTCDVPIYSMPGSTPFSLHWSPSSAKTQHWDIEHLLTATKLSVLIFQPLKNCHSKWNAKNNQVTNKVHVHYAKVKVQKLSKWSMEITTLQALVWSRKAVQHSALPHAVWASSIIPRVL